MYLKFHYLNLGKRYWTDRIVNKSMRLTVLGTNGNNGLGEFVIDVGKKDI